MPPSDIQAALQVLALKPVRKNLVKLVPEQKENVNLDCQPDNGTEQMSISLSMLKMRRVHSLTSILSARSKVISRYDPLYLSCFHFGKQR